MTLDEVMIMQGDSDQTAALTSDEPKAGFLGRTEEIPSVVSDEQWLAGELPGETREMLIHPLPPTGLQVAARINDTLSASLATLASMGANIVILETIEKAVQQTLFLAASLVQQQRLGAEQGAVITRLTDRLDGIHNARGNAGQEQGAN